VILGGQTLSLVLTLLVTPVAYSLLDDFGKWLRRMLGRLVQRRSKPTVVEPTHAVTAAGDQLDSNLPSR
jgi:hypothetical protein